MSSESSLDSILEYIPDFVEKWVMLEDEEPLAELHSKFWGTSMQEEEEAWRAKERPTSSHASVTNLGSDEIEEDEDEEIIPGCYALEINNEGISLKTIWVRAEYIRIYDQLVEYYNEHSTPKDPMRPTPSAVITGQPGIGKSVWIYYALRRCLAERRPVIFRYLGREFLFVEDGVYLMGSSFQLAHFKRTIWTLVDTDESRTGVPSTLIYRGTRLFVIYVSFPVKERWSSLEKTTRNAVMVMNPWSRGEIHQAAKLYSDRLDSNLVDDIYDQFGPTPHLCIVDASDSKALAAHEDKVNIALEGLAWPQHLQELMDKLQESRMDDTFHELCLIKRQNIDNVRSAPFVTLITDRIRSRIAKGPLKGAQFTRLSSQGHELQTTKLFSSKVKMENYPEVGRFEEREEAEERPPHKKRKCIETPAEVPAVGEGPKQ